MTIFKSRFLIILLFLLDPDFTGEATFVLSKKNTFKLVFNGHSYSQHRKRSDGATYWLCCRRNQFKCKAKLHTKRIGSREMVRIVNDQHSHPSEHPEL